MVSGFCGASADPKTVRNAIAARIDERDPGGRQPQHRTARAARVFPLMCPLPSLDRYSKPSSVLTTQVDHDRRRR